MATIARLTPGIDIDADTKTEILDLVEAYGAARAALVAGPWTSEKLAVVQGHYSHLLDILYGKIVEVEA